MTYFLDVTTTGDMTQITGRRRALKSFHECTLECCLWEGDHLLGEKLFMEDDDGVHLETVMFKREKAET